MLSKARVKRLKGLGFIALLGCSAGISSVVMAEDLLWTGAERSGNKDGTIPEYGGMDKPMPGYSYGKFRGDYWSHKGEKPGGTALNPPRWAGAAPPAAGAAAPGAPAGRAGGWPKPRGNITLGFASAGASIGCQVWAHTP